MRECIYAASLSLTRTAPASAHRLVASAAIAIAVLASLPGIIGATEPPAPPVMGDPAAKVSLFAAEPDIVTPIGATVDAKGRLLVIESNTHFRPKNYQGAPTDRIRIFEDPHGVGKAEKISTFYEGETYMMNLAADRDGSVLVSSRVEIFRLIDEQGHGAATRKISLATLKTTDNYPHNGLHGLAIDRDGNIYFSIGENHSEPWTLTAADGRTLSNATGSGEVFRMDASGKNLTLIARGFWNPFGLGFDSAGNLWAVDNDPDGRPPCRLIHVVPGADYGFEFRYGRTGMHPLQAWDGDLPGTLGMTAGVGEAPCEVVFHDGGLFVSSWRDHQLQEFTPQAHGAAFTASMTPVATGGDAFRPVGIAFGPDGALYLTDWASGSYSVNGKGRIWKMILPHPATVPSLAPTPAMLRAAELRESSNVSELVSALDDADASMAQAAQYGLSRLDAVEKIDWSTLATSRQKIGLLAALVWRGAAASPLIPKALADADDRVRQMAVRAITEQDIKSARTDLAHLLSSQSMSPRLLGMTIAAINLLDGDPAARIDSKKIEKVLLARLEAPNASEESKATTLSMLLAGHPTIDFAQIEPLLGSKLAALQLAAVRYVTADARPEKRAMLERVAGSKDASPEIRAEAVLGLSDSAADSQSLLLQLARNDNDVIRHEALRSLRPIGPKLDDAAKSRLKKTVDAHPADADLVQRVFGPITSARPPEDDDAAWQALAAKAPGDPAAGRRIFFHPAGPGCFRCHMVEGRGRQIGPDLTMIGHSQTGQHVLISILDPSREIGPLFTVWSIKKKNGDQVDGMLLRRDGQSNEVYVDASGVETHVMEKDVAERRIRKESLMPTGLVQGMTDQELRDVLAFLVQKR